MVRKAIESLYVGKCTITKKQKVIDPITKRTKFEDVSFCLDEPCRLSYSNVSATDETDTVSKVSQVIKLFLKPELMIEAGSKITVTQHGRTIRYVASGQPAVHTNHQEIVLELDDDEA